MGMHSPVCTACCVSEQIGNWNPTFDRFSSSLPYDPSQNLNIKIIRRSDFVARPLVLPGFMLSAFAHGFGHPAAGETLLVKPSILDST
jgi:hypothetical protein